MGIHQTGTRSELRACAWLIERGYEVFRNVCSHGPIDLVAIRGDEVLMIDVKTERKNQPVPVLTQMQHDRGIVAITVDNYGNCKIVTDFSVKGSRGPRRKRVPPVLTVIAGGGSDGDAA